MSAAPSEVMTARTTKADASSLADTNTVTDTHARRSEKLLLYSCCFFRLAGLPQIGVVLALGAARHHSLGYVPALVAGVTIESLLLVAGCLRRGRLVPMWITADAVFCTSALILNAQVSLPGDTRWSQYMMYGFTVGASSVAIGVTYPRLSTVLAMTAVVSSGYALSEVLLRGEHDLNTNALGYFAAAVPAWAVARELRRSARAADASHAQAMAQASELAIERERTHYARMLHDRVLQTLEVLATGGWIADPAVHAHIAAEASWLRAVVQGTPVSQPRDLLAVLQSVVQDKARSGLRVEFNEAGLRAAEKLRGELPPAVVDAVAGAVREALTNVSKHAAVDTAVVRATLDADRLTVSVLDHGIGFDPAPATTDPLVGIGLAQSVHARIEEIGGTTRIESEPGAGTYVELSIPAPTTQPDPPPPSSSSWLRPPGYSRSPVLPGLALILTIAITVAILVWVNNASSGPTHAASGGGCGSVSTLLGLSVKACINVSNDRAVNSDGYASGGSTVGDCTFRISIVNVDNPNLPAAVYQPCTAGHLIGPSRFNLSGTYYTRICVVRPPPGGYPCVTSPLQTL